AAVLISAAGYIVVNLLVDLLYSVVGGYAEFAVREVESVQVLPEGTDPTAAVAMIGTGRTTMSILRIARPSSDDVVLVTSAAGGIGALAVQHARNIGATVVGAAGGPLKAGKVGELGADLAVDYTEEGWADRVREELGRPVSLVLDGAGGAYGRAAFDLIGPGGRIVMYGRQFGEHRFTSDDLVNRSVAASVALGPNLLKDVPGGMRELEDEALAALADGSLKPLVGPPFPLAEAAAAHVALENRQTYGKVVLVPRRH
ncbi:zinc-binding dehydrogenase, partial [Saccharopolyspora kobensis]|uniref:zinc-binding dehydrogenase n=1 Tax=Saccharopolyspora kobensis TaxID=146035 RepID=UPI00331A067F